MHPARSAPRIHVLRLPLCFGRLTQSALLVLSHNMSQSLKEAMKEAIDACKKPYSVESEDAAVAAVEKWLYDP